jgi:hypothetical protein
MLRSATVWKRRSSVSRCKSVAVDELDVKQVWTERPCMSRDSTCGNVAKLDDRSVGAHGIGRFGDNLCMQRRAK